MIVISDKMRKIFAENLYNLLTERNMKTVCIKGIYSEAPNLRDDLYVVKLAENIDVQDLIKKAAEKVMDKETLSVGDFSEILEYLIGEEKIVDYEVIDDVFIFDNDYPALGVRDDA